jgi:hydroxylamine reductase (hybrid-cluster protein)
MADAIKKLSFAHEGLMNSMLANPQWTYADHAVALGYTQAWVSQIVNSDMFQAELHSRAREAGVTLAVSIQEKMRATFALTLEEAANRIQNGACSERFVTDTMKNLAQTAEFAPAAAPVGPTYNLNVSAEYLEKVRLRAAEAKRGQTVAKLPAPATSAEREAEEAGELIDVSASVM